MFECLEQNVINQRWKMELNEVVTKFSSVDLDQIENWHNDGDEFVQVNILHREDQWNNHRTIPKDQAKHQHHLTTSMYQRRKSNVVSKLVQPIRCQSNGEIREMFHRDKSFSMIDRDMSSEEHRDNPMFQSMKMDKDERDEISLLSIFFQFPSRKEDGFNHFNGNRFESINWDLHSLDDEQQICPNSSRSNAERRFFHKGIA